MASASEPFPERPICQKGRGGRDGKKSEATVSCIHSSRRRKEGRKGWNEWDEEGMMRKMTNCLSQKLTFRLWSKTRELSVTSSDVRIGVHLLRHFVRLDRATRVLKRMSSLNGDKK